MWQYLYHKTPINQGQIVVNKCSTLMEIEENLISLSFYQNLKKYFDA